MANGSTQPFRVTETVTLLCSGSGVEDMLMEAGDTALVYNSSASIAFVRFGTSQADATVDPATDFPIPPGDTRMLAISPFVTWVGIAVGATGTGTGTVYVSRGAGTVY